MQQQSRWPRGWQGVVLMLVTMYLGAVLITPAQAHFTTNLKHLLRHVKKIVYTKAQANALFVNGIDGTDKAPDAAHADEADHALEADTAGDADTLDGMDSADFAITGHTHPGTDITSAVAQANNAGTLDGLDSTAFVQNSGLVLLAVPWTSWSINPSSGADVALKKWSNLTWIEKGSAGTGFVDTAPTTPVAAYGKKLQLVGMELCYLATGANVTLNDVFLRVWRHSSSAIASAVATVRDTTDRDDQACRLYSLASPFVLSEEDSVTTSLDISYSGAATGFNSLVVGRTTLILQPTGTSAVTPSSPSSARLESSGDEASNAGLPPGS